MKNVVFTVAVLLCVSLVLVGCGANKEASSSAAIEKSQALATVQQKVDYLAGQAKAFINSKQYDQAVSTAQYILSNLDSNSQQARSLISQAKDALAIQAKAKVDEAKKKLGLGQ
ncbi:MAG: hypothetical protein NT036_06505 [Candidatus Omnitrophica bacterium]|nr:hypothetical protein [Candidatus Omnitrophota bacterium]